jgi:ABC-2 type transport system permease protein
MSSYSALASPNSSGEQVPSPERTLRQLFLTLFLRGRSSRGLQKKSAPKSVGQKLALTLVFYTLIGCLAFSFVRQPIFLLSVYLHAMTFVFLGMFVASSAGEVLFNREEADVLLHRPVGPRALLWAKVAVLVEVSLWISVAFNLVGFFVGVWAPDGGLRFPIAHLVSTTLEAMFCTGCVVMIYQLCLRYFGRERLEGLMTAAQVIISVAAVLSGQILPQIVFRANLIGDVGLTSWWIGLLPPAWFAGFDDAFAGSSAVGSWLLAALAVTVTGFVLWIAFGKLARDYETGLQMLNETVSSRTRKRNSRRWLDTFVDWPPLRWLLRDPVTRASFLLSAAYLVRDRDVKLRIYPGIAPMLVVPVIFLMQGRDQGGFGGGFGVAFAGGYLGLVPLLALNMLQYSQQWQASDIFRAAPIHGPGPLCHGARRAVMVFLALPVLAISGVVAWLMQNDTSQLLLLIPGAIAVPIFALIPNLGGRAIPLSVPTEEAKSTGRGLMMIAIIPVSMAISGLAAFSWATGWFWWLVLVETIVAIGLYLILRRWVTNAYWPSLE